jgi:hypothetical protein
METCFERNTVKESGIAVKVQVGSTQEILLQVVEKDME